MSLFQQKLNLINFFFVDVKVTFPEEYQAKELAGKEAIFKCAVKKIEAKELPELDDDFAKDVSEFDTLAEYKEHVKTNLEDKKADEAKRAKEDAAVDKAIENAQMDIPEAMLMTQCRQMLDDFSRRMQSQGLSMDQYFQFTGMTADKMMDELRPQAEKRIKTRLVLEAIAKAENIEITDEKLDEEIAKMAEAYKMEVEKVKAIVSKEALEGDLKISNALEFIKKNAKVKKAAKKVVRWQQIAESAAKQSKRMLIPEIHEVMTYKQALEFAKQLDVKLIPYELAKGMKETREILSEIKPGQSVGIFIGPEGGFEEEEVAKALEAGAHAITLGRRILRTETAGLAILSVLMFQLENE